MPDEDEQAGEVDNAEEVFDVEFPSCDDGGDRSASMQRASRPVP